MGTKMVIWLSFLLFLSCSSRSLENSSGLQQKIKSPTGLFPVQQGNKWGYIDGTGRMIINPSFEYAGLFTEGIAVVNVSPKLGYIDMDGNYILPPQFSQATGFSDGLAKVCINNKCGFIDKAGKYVIPPSPMLVSASSFSEGLAAVSINNKYGFIDKSGQIAIQPKFDSAYGFTEGLASVKSGDKWGYIDKTGSYVINPQPYWWANNFSEGLAAVALESGNKYGFIDKTGKFVINPQFRYAKDFSEGFAIVVINDKYGYIDKAGNYLIEPIFKSADEFSEGLAAIETREGYGYIDKTGKIAVNPKYDKASSFRNGLASVSIEDTSMYIDANGNEIWSYTPQPPPGSPKKAGQQEIEAVVRQMAIDNEISADCIEEAGAARRLVDVYLGDLNGDDEPELAIMGKDCACGGARRCFQWIYRKTTEGYELILSAGPVEDIEPLKTFTNGFPDLSVAFPPANDLSMLVEVYKFDGRRYQKVRSGITR